MFTPTVTLVPKNTSTRANRRIRKEIERRIDFYAAHPERIERRLAELDKEWDVERCLETGSATLTLTGVLLGAFVNRKWLILPGLVQAFFAQHALQGWCPPLPLLRRMGVRTAGEIAQERYALKALRGDFAGAHEPGGEAPRRVKRAVGVAQVELIGETGG